MVYDYSPYGERTSESLEGTEAAVLSPFGFTGAYQFQDGTVHLNHRFHSTFTMGFTQPDPSRQEMNNYNYAQCDPINNTDPTGLCTASAVDFVFGFASYVGAAYTLSGMAAGTIAVAAGPVAWAVATGVMAVWGVSRGIQGMNQNC
ncbi:RHS repeat-associated core domain-containing protein [Nocardiopsis dassonvillei]